MTRYRQSEEGRTKTREQKKKYRQKIKDEVYAHYGGYKCACCGETRPFFLSIDHIDQLYDPVEKKSRKREGVGSQMYEYLRRNGFPPGFQILCMNCNHARFRCGGRCPCQDGKQHPPFPFIA